MHHKAPPPFRGEAATPVRPRVLLAGGVTGVLMTSAAHADAPPRCAVLGQVATAVYARTGCDAGQLAAAMDCLLTEGDGSTSPRVTARDCLAQARLLP